MANKVRKTVPVSDVVKYANRLLADTHDGMVTERLTIIVFLERILHDANAYNGFQYLSSEFDSNGAGLRNDYDDTRRRYYDINA